MLPRRPPAVPRSRSGAVVVLAVLVALTLNGIANVGKEWNDVANQVLKKRDAIDDASKALTDGIHHFKNYVIRRQDFETVNGTRYLVERPRNMEGGELKGIELAYRQFYDFLPGWLSGFGTQLNATYIDSSQALPAALGEAGQDTDIPGVSKWSFNAVGIYEKGPVSARLAYNWRSRVTNFFATDPQGRLIGAEFNSEMERQTKRDTTEGAEKPLGQRGFKVALSFEDRRMF